MAGVTITSKITEAYDIETYDGLVAFLTAHLELDATTVAQLPTLIRLAEYRLDRLILHPDREAKTTLTTTADQQYVSLPTDFRTLRTVYYVADNGWPLAPVSLNVLHSQYTDDSAKPTVYAIQTGQLFLGPVPDAAYDLDVTYIKRLVPISETNQTNWLLTDNADAYLYATIFHIAAWLEDLELASQAEGEMFRIIDEMAGVTNRYRRAAPARLRSPVVV